MSTRYWALRKPITRVAFCRADACEEEIEATIWVEGAKMPFFAVVPRKTADQLVEALFCSDTTLRVDHLISDREPTRTTVRSEYGKIVEVTSRVIGPVLPEV